MHGVWLTALHAAAQRKDDAALDILLASAALRSWARAELRAHQLPRMRDSQDSMAVWMQTRKVSESVIVKKENQSTQMARRMVLSEMLG